VNADNKNGKLQREHWI